MAFIRPNSYYGRRAALVNQRRRDALYYDSDLAKQEKPNICQICGHTLIKAMVCSSLHVN
jgi:hypothetical protein